MQYKFDFKKVRKKYTKRMVNKKKPVEHIKDIEKREREIKLMIQFLNNWFAGRVIVNEYRILLQKFGVLQLVQNNQIDKAIKLLSNC